jgi:hypothetical protein
MMGRGAAGEFNGSQLALVRFDLPPVPSYLIGKATVHLYHTGGNRQDVAVHRMKVEWKEDEATFSAPSVDAPSWEAGWISGDNYEVQPTDTVSVNDPDRWYDWDVTEDIKAFQDGTLNHGWVVMAEDASSSDPDMDGTMFAARETGGERSGYLKIGLKNSIMAETFNEKIPPSMDNIVRWAGRPTHARIIEDAIIKMNVPNLDVQAAYDAAEKPDYWPKNALSPYNDLPIIIPPPWSLIIDWDTFIDSITEISHSVMHYYDPNVLNLSFEFGYAPDACQSNADNAKGYFQNRDYYAASESIAYSSHFLTDVGNPMHTGLEIEQIKD